MKKVLIVIVSVFSFSQANADVFKCLDPEDGTSWYIDKESEMKNEIKRGRICKNLNRQKSLNLEALLTPQQRKEIEARRRQKEAYYQKKAEEAAEARYLEQVRATAKFLDDVEAARKNK